MASVTHLLECFVMGVGHDGLTQAVAAGAASAATTLVLYPLDVVKTRLNRGVDEEGERYAGFCDVVKRQWKSKGMQGFYRGIRVCDPLNKCSL